MKFLFTTLLITGYVAINVLGIFGMHMQAPTDAQNHHELKSNCIGAIVKGTDCPKETDPIDFVAFHVEAFKGFSLATLGENTTNGLLLVLSLILFTGLRLWLHLRLPQIASHRYSFGDTFSPPQKQKLARWLALHENSPAVS